MPSSFRLFARLTIGLGIALVSGPVFASDLATPETRSSIEKVRSEAQKGDFVSVRGTVTRISSNRFFDLQDEFGAQMIVLISDHIQREAGTPRTGETIRVRGKYDHKTLLQPSKAERADPEKNWGIRVSNLERNLSVSGRNPHQAPAWDPEPLTTSPTPAAPAGDLRVASPRASSELKERMGKARQRVLSAQRVASEADAKLAQGQYRGVSGAELEELETEQEAAQLQIAEAKSAIAPLVDEARGEGVDETLLELYESGITRPKR
jgi:hypothetical protein